MAIRTMAEKLITEMLRVETTPRLKMEIPQKVKKKQKAEILQKVKTS